MPETLTLDPTSENTANTPVELNSGDIVLTAHSYPAPPLEVTWQGSIDTEGQQPAARKYGNRTITITVECWTQAALDQLQAKLGKIDSDGGTLKRALATGEEIVFDLLARDQFDPAFDITYHAGNVAVVQMSFTAAPLGRGTPLEDITDDFATSGTTTGTLGDVYDFVQGPAATAFVSAGQLGTTNTTQKRLVHKVSPWPMCDLEVTVKVTTGSTITGGQWGAIAKHVDANNWLAARIEAGTNVLRLVRCTTALGGTSTLGSTAAFTPASATSYWVRTRIEADKVTGEVFTAAPTATSTPVATTTATLITADAATVGKGIAGRGGIYWAVIADTAEKFDDLTIRPNVSRSSLPQLDTAIYGIPGNAPAETTLVITDAEGADRRYAQWGAGPDTTNALIIDSDQLATSGFAGTQQTSTGAYDPNASGNNAIRVALFGGVATIVAVCGTGTLQHRGRYRVFGRVKPTEPDARVRLMWQHNDGPFSPNPWFTVTQEDVWSDADLGEIALPETDLGDQEWSGRLEAYNLNGGNIDIDFLTLVPVDHGYGVAKAVASNLAGVVVGYGNFTSTTAGNPLDGTAAAIGGNWDSSWTGQDATDFAFSDDSVGLSGETITRSVGSGTAGRFAVLGSTDYTDTQVEVGVRSPGSATAELGVIARWTDADNYLRAVVFSRRLIITQRVAGVETELRRVAALGGDPSLSGIAIRLVAMASGSYVAQVLNVSKSTVLHTITGVAATLATGGALEDGRPGIFDRRTQSGTLNRYYDNFTVYTPAREDVVLYAGRELRVASHGRVERASSDGSTFGKPTWWEGHRVTLPPGDSRIAARAHRGDLITGTHDVLDDLLQVQVAPIVPRYLVVPEAQP